jgi:hypothetical protein
MKNIILIISITLLCLSCEQYEPNLKYPLIYTDTSRVKHARWSSYVKTIIVKDSCGEMIQLFTERGYCSEYVDSIYRNCNIGDTIRRIKK